MAKSPEQYEKEVGEQRLVEATKKGLNGKDGKLSVILKNLGEPIIHQSGIYTDQDFEDVYNSQELRDKIPMHIDRDEDLLMMPGNYEDDPIYGPWMKNPDMQYINQFIVGWIFSGLNRGMHLEIQYMKHNNTLTCHYKGYEVFREVRGELKGYAPLKEWENWIEKLFLIAKEKKVKKQIVNEQEYNKTKELEKLSWWEKFRLRWGL
jgi:hypothetical protein